VRPTALAFSGAIASGKTTIAMEVAESFRWPLVAFGDYVRSIAAERGLSRTRAILQDLGTQLIAEQGWEGFCRSVLGTTSWEPGGSIVIDGVRHAEVALALRALVAPSEFCLVLIETSSAVRTNRLRERDTANAYSRAAMETHSTEVQLADRLPTLADLRIDGSHPCNDTVRAILDWLRDRQGV